MATILITGGTGLIGTELTTHLQDLGHRIRHLSRSKTGSERIPTFKWDVKKRQMDDAALEDVDHIVHLAGAGIADRAWTRARVTELIESRVASADLLRERAQALGLRPKSMISAAGINYYGAITSDHLFKESDPPGSDTIAYISLQWEKGIDAWKKICRVVKLRTPVVLAAAGGALPPLARPVRFGVGAALGKGDQWFPWIHINDLVRIYAKAIEDESMEGVYNVGPSADTTNEDLMHTIAQVLKKPFFLPAVPAFAMKLVLGRMASVLLEGSRADNSRLLATGFRFDHTELRPALEDLLIRKN